MKNFKSTCFLLILFLGLQTAAFAQADRATTKLKKYFNDVVQKVEQAEQPEMKRQILNESLEDLRTALDKVADMQSISEEDQTAIAQLRANVTEKQNELNGLNGFEGVKNNQLNNFANFVQQDLEQADETITISVTVLLLIIIILLLL